LSPVQLVVLRLAVRAELAPLDQLLDAAMERRAAEPVEPPVEGEDLGRPQAPDERRVAARHVEPVADGEGVADHVEAQHGRGAGIGQQQRRQNREEGRLSRAVGSQEAEEGAAFHLEARARERLGATAPEVTTPEGLHEIARVDGKHNPFIVTRRRDAVARGEPIW